jgi:hypothetical protein
MKLPVDAPQVGADTDNQKKSHGQHGLENLGIEVHPIGPAEEQTVRPNTGQANRHAQGRQNKGRKIFMPGAGGRPHGHNRKNDHR